MNIAGGFVKAARKWLPSPFTLAILLTVLTYVLALLLTKPESGSTEPYALQLVGFWQQGFWELLTFTIQMMLILVLGHTLALTKPVDKLISQLLVLCTSTARAALVVTFFTVTMALINWGLGLIFGAIFARKVGEYAQHKGYKINYPLIGAAGYSGLMVWHGGLSGSAPLDVATEGHKLQDLIGIIPTDYTLFSPMNLTVALVCLLVLPLLMYAIGTRVEPTKLPKYLQSHLKRTKSKAIGAEKLDRSKLLGTAVGLVFVGYAVYKAFVIPERLSLKFLNLNDINFFLFGMALLFHGSFESLIAAFEEAIKGASGIMLQFPLYAGIIGLMKYSGLLVVYAGFFINHSTPESFSFLTFISAGIVNIFVPSGGGQWAVQGPIIVEACKEMGLPLAKNVMALAYGDQLTNMLQPFWALPLLGITGLKAQEVLPYTFMLFVAGFVIFGAAILFF